jgi:hypothetical protein
VFLFIRGEIQHLFRVVQQYGALSLGLGKIETTSVDSDFAFVDFFDDTWIKSIRQNTGMDTHRVPSGSRLKTIPWSTELAAKLPPMILTTRMLSVLKLAGLLGITITAASATRRARRTSSPYCFEEIAGFTASANESTVSGCFSVLTESSEKPNKVAKV